MEGKPWFFRIFTLAFHAYFTVWLSKVTVKIPKNKQSTMLSTRESNNIAHIFFFELLF